MTVSGNKFILRMFGLVARHGNNESDKLGRGNNLIANCHKASQKDANVLHVMKTDPIYWTI